MADVSFNRNPQNPGNFDLHAWYGGDKAGLPGQHGHLQIDQHGTVFHRVPAVNALGQLAVQGTLPQPFHR